MSRWLREIGSYARLQLGLAGSFLAFGLATKLAFGEQVPSGNSEALGWTLLVAIVAAFVGQARGRELNRYGGAALFIAGMSAALVASSRLFSDRSIVGGDAATVFVSGAILFVGIALAVAMDVSHREPRLIDTKGSMEDAT